MNSGAQINIQSGGHLILNNGAELTAVTDWGGIVVNGTAAIEQFDPMAVGGGFPDPSINMSTVAFEGVLNPSQASVIVDNGKVNKANVGIASTNGGIVRISNSSTFTDCDYFVDISDYMSSSQPNVNACYMMNSLFQWVTKDGGFANPMIRCASVRGVSVGGMTLQNINTSRICNRGIGIEADGADISVSIGGTMFCTETAGLMCGTTLCGGSRGIIKNLSVGVLSQPSATNSNQILGVSSTDFSDNMVSIQTRQGQQLKIYNNTFTNTAANNFANFNNSSIRECHFHYDIVDIWTSGTRCIKAYLNSFTYDGYSNLTDRGIVNIFSEGNDDWTSVIKNNSFTNTNANFNVSASKVTGIRLYGNYRGTEILCNTFTNLGTDVDLNFNANTMGSSTAVKGVQKNTNLSGATRSAGNKFSAFGANRLRFDNRGNSSVEYHFTPNIPTSLADIENPVSTSFTALTMNLTLVTDVLNEGSDCEMRCTTMLTSIEENRTGKTRLIVMPQPGNNEITISLTDYHVSYDAFGIYDAQGRLVTTGHIDDINHFIVNTAELSNGIYFIDLTNSSGQRIYQKIQIIH